MANVLNGPLRQVFAASALVLVASGSARAQASTEQIIDAAAAAMGGRDRIQAVRTLSIEGVGKEFNFGQAARPIGHPVGSESSVSKVLSYRRAYDLSARRLKFEKKRLVIYSFFAGHVPITTVESLDGEVAFNVAAGGITRVWAPTAANARVVEFYRHPVTILQAALGGARLSNPQTRDGERSVDVGLPNSHLVVTLVTDSTTNLPTRVEAMTDIPIVGDIAVETRFSDYAAEGGLQLPGRLTTRNGGRYPVSDVRIRQQRVNAEVGNLAAPEAVASAMPPAPPRAPEVTAVQAAPSVWHLRDGSTHNGVLIEFGDHLALVDGADEPRMLAQIAKARELRPNKPLTTLILTHHHLDHTGGVRAAFAEGITRFVAHRSIHDFVRDVIRRPHTIAPDALARKPQAKPISLVPVDDTLMLKDGAMTVNLYHLPDFAHAASMLMLYFPNGRLLTDADLYFPGDTRTVTAVEPEGHGAFFHTLLANIEYRQLAVDRMMPMHGDMVPYRQFQEAALTLSALATAN